MKILRFLFSLVQIAIILFTLSTISVKAQESDWWGEGRYPSQKGNYIGASIGYILKIEFDLQEIKGLRFKNLGYKSEKVPSACMTIMVQYIDFRPGPYEERFYVYAFKNVGCHDIIYSERPSDIIEKITLGPEYETAFEYFDEAIEEEDPIKLKMGFLYFLAEQFPDNPLYLAQLEALLPTSTPTPTLTPTPTSTSTSTPTPTYTLTPTSTSTSTPTSTPEPTATPTPTQATLLIVTSNFITDLQAGENIYLVVIIVLIIVLVFIGIGVLINKQLRRKETIR